MIIQKLALLTFSSCVVIYKFYHLAWDLELDHLRIARQLLPHYTPPTSMFHMCVQIEL